MLNQRCHIKRGESEDDQSRVMIVMCEVIGTNAAALMEAFERSLLQAYVEALDPNCIITAAPEVASARASLFRRMVCSF